MPVIFDMRNIFPKNQSAAEHPHAHTPPITIHGKNHPAIFSQTFGMMLIFYSITLGDEDIEGIYNSYTQHFPKF